MNQLTQGSGLAGIDQDAAAAMVESAKLGILNEIQRGRSVDDAVARVRQRETAQFAPLGVHGASILQLRHEALSVAHRQVLEDIQRISYLQQSSLRSGREGWYAGPAEDADNWHGLKRRLVAQSRSKEELELVDEESNTVLSLIDNPGKESFSTRGLVIGHVQSGKTGNIAALIAKAADTPFKFVLVLSGMTDSLRNQTQDRLDRDVVGTAPHGHWYAWTRVNKRVGDVLENGDFQSPVGGTFQLQGPGNHLAVIKKNAGVLRRFLRTLRQTPMRDLEQTPFLIIDDECDQASVNSAPLKRAISKINDLIRQIVGHLPRVAYVGYTATPFANVLIDPSVPSDLYPRHFIHPLRRPSAYFGAVELFGRSALQGEAEDVDSGYDMVRIVDPEEIPKLRPAGAKAAGFTFEVTESLEQAIRYFVMVIAARMHREHVASHMSMLVHTSMLNSVHRLTRIAIAEYLSTLVNGLERGDESLLGELRDQWEEETAAVPAATFGRDQTDFDAIRPLLFEAASSIDIKVENWSSSDRIDYSIPGRRYLVIGGNVLARGLTLEGLAVSFFMRTSSQYDTLMQMGRWFGYRPGFEDLPRIWMEEDVRDAFFDLATVEEELRRDACHYADAQVTPEQFAVRIRKIPGLMITARNKMAGAVMAEVGYAGRHLQTIRFLRRDDDWLKRNWDAAAALIDGAGAPPVDIRGNKVLKAVDVERVQAFLQQYEVHETNASMRSEDLRAYITKALERDSALAQWNVVIATGGSGGTSLHPLGQLGTVACVNRAPMRGSGDDASIKALMSKDDLLGDIGELSPEGERSNWDQIKVVRERLRLPPLLVLYPIDRNSRPMRKGERFQGDQAVREEMGAVRDLLGVGIYFPGQAELSLTYVSARLPPQEAEEEFVAEDAMPAELIDDAR